MRPVFTIGHSTHTQEQFLSLLRMHGITAVADVRSSPYSRMNPQFNREQLSLKLGMTRIRYAFLGTELGGRCSDPSCFAEGRVQFSRLAARTEFSVGLDRVVDGAKRFTIALLCAEKDPLNCHRAILVSRHLVERGFEVHHVHSDGTIETHAAAVERLLREVGLGDEDLFTQKAERIAEAYARRETVIAYSEETKEPAIEYADVGVPK